MKLYFQDHGEIIGCLDTGSIDVLGSNHPQGPDWPPRSPHYIEVPLRFSFAAPDLLKACKSFLDAMILQQIADRANGNASAAASCQPFIDEGQTTIAKAEG